MGLQNILAKELRGKIFGFRGLCRTAGLKDDLRMRLYFDYRERSEIDVPRSWAADVALFQRFE
jgi:hypothetical protein